MPQLAVSISYYYYNTVLTAMLMASEYDGYAVAGTCDAAMLEKPKMAPRKSLRVSGTPKGAQRSTYWLSLPYRYSIPLLVTYAVLHWLVSQSIFYVRVTLYNAAQEHVSDADINACGWSPMALILSLAVGGLMVLTLLFLGLRRFRSYIPLAGSCSAAISAACHRPSDDSTAAIEAITWGEVSGSPIERTALVSSGVAVGGHRTNQNTGHRTRPLGHCSFTSYVVTQPSLNRLYY